MTKMLVNQLSRLTWIRLTLAILTVLVAGGSHSGINVVASGAVCWGTVGLRG